MCIEYTARLICDACSDTSPEVVGTRLWLWLWLGRKALKAAEAAGWRRSDWGTFRDLCPCCLDKERHGEL